MNSCLVTQAHYFWSERFFVCFVSLCLWMIVFLCALSLGFVSGFRFVFDDTSSPLYSFQFLFSARPMAIALQCPPPLTHLRQSTFAKLFQFIFAPCDGFFSLARWRENQFNGGSDGVYWPVTHASQQHRSRFTRIILFLSPIALRESENKSMWRVAHLSRCLL